VDTISVDVPQVVKTPNKSSIPIMLKNVEDHADKYLNLAVGANVLIIFLLYFFFLALSSPIVGPSCFK
jgi:hypothetical protein